MHLKVFIQQRHFGHFYFIALLITEFYDKRAIIAQLLQLSCGCDLQNKGEDF